MVTIGYAAALEQLHPRDAVDLAQTAERSGFTGVMATDVMQPWVPAQGQAAFVWNVLAAVAERTAGDVGPGVSVPTFRWHPAVLAQASATLAAMYPGRHWLGIGSGEAINEHVVGRYWPEAPERINRMFEAIDMISKLFSSSLAGKDHKHSGEYFTLESTRLWTMPPTAPEILVATAGPVTARRAGRHADGLITMGGTSEKVGQLFGRFAAGAKDAGKDATAMPRVIRLHLSWARTEAEAVRNAVTEWPNGAMKFSKADLRSPFEVAQIAKLVRPGDFAGAMVVSADTEDHLREIQRYVDLGASRIYLHNVGRNQDEFLRVFGTDVLPKVVH
ncbi:TIGR03557 family F420-dependent LLM class oxidoreductase [Ruania halotolerans]|uniref:TIGR03557 family F420-dependent LLM class oxidoreductase n=1 Tax=Ruania halotolerans TaxID=2897773 RepID=UPI001E60B67B|nr:TIGR03557 family F420-dependent LLM class oxidoreductase [Ruania halotolerans]UFU05272.1 TIGR03557 family F420-dependent LLM class oxidoreductase [Ruania halotolerans]